MPNPTPVCSDTTAVLWGFILKKPNNKNHHHRYQKTQQEILGGRLLLLFKGEKRDPRNPWSCGIAHHHLKPVLLVYSSECSFCVKN